MGLQGGWSAAAAGLVAKPCDSCKASAAALFCRADLAFLCLACDARIHAANKLTTRHERVWMCEVCEQAPAAVTCKADAAALCVTCDADIHSANPLSRRHERVPVEPFYDSAESIIVKSTTTAPLSAAAAFNYLVPNGDVLSNTKDIENDASSNWLIPNLNFNSKLQMDIAPDIIKSSGELLFPEMDSLLELDYPNSIHNISGAGTSTDSVVPVQPDPIPPPSFNMNHNISGPADQNCFDLDFCRSKLSSSFCYPTQSLSQSVSSSSLDVGVVPDGNSLSDISYSFGRNANNNVLEPGDISYSFGPKASNNVSEPDDISYPFGRKASNNVSEPGVPVLGTPASQPATQLCGLDREARVLRYREKRKNRKFQKTIRYASRKAYAETRPRIKGRFAKRTETEAVNRIYGSGPGTFIPDPQFGVVPTF